METLFLVKVKFGSDIAGKVSEYLSGSRKIWLAKYRFALRNNGIPPVLRARRVAVFGVTELRDTWWNKWLTPLQTELRHAGLAWRVQTRRLWKK
jgi:hypothetical protein